MIIRKTVKADIDEAAAIYDMARAFMRRSGNLHQWSSGHPNRQDIENDIALDGSYVAVDESGEIIAVFFFKVWEDPTYKSIYEGEWKSPLPYGVIHRVAVKYNGRGIADSIYSFCYSLHPHLRIDTHRDNLPMQRSLEKNGFERRGIIYLENREERLAYEKI